MLPRARLVMQCPGLLVLPLWAAAALLAATSGRMTKLLLVMTAQQSLRKDSGTC